MKKNAKKMTIEEVIINLECMAIEITGAMALKPNALGELHLDTIDTAIDYLKNIEIKK